MELYEWRVFSDANSSCIISGTIERQDVVGHVQEKLRCRKLTLHQNHSRCDGIRMMVDMRFGTVKHAHCCTQILMDILNTHVSGSLQSTDPGFLSL